MKIIKLHKQENKGKPHRCMNRSRSHASLLPRLEAMYREMLPSDNLLVERRRNAVDAVVKAAGKRSAEVVEFNLLGVDLEMLSQLLFSRISRRFMNLQR
jgi:hypothetical protein